MNRVCFTRELPDETVETVPQFLERIARACHGQWYFRGQPLDLPESLMPSIGREFSFAGRTLCFSGAQERSLLQRFRRHAYKQYNRVLTEWEVLFLARHHELPVRLLDWTTNPMVALYFASRYERPSEASDGCVWAVKRRDDEIRELDVFDAEIAPLEVKGIKLVYPFYPTPRLTEQSGIFTLHEDPWTHLDGLAGKPYPEDELDIERLKKWIVPAQVKQSIIYELERLSVNTRSLFPDLDGLSRGLWQSEVLRSGEPPNASTQPGGD